MQFDLSTKRPFSGDEWVSLTEEQRIGIHPLFKSIEGYPCLFFYNKKFKCFWVDHHYNEETGEYEKSILSNIPASIVDDVLGVLNVV